MREKLENREIYLLSGNEVLQFAKEISELLKKGEDFKPTNRKDKQWAIQLSKQDAEFLKSRGVLIELVSDHNDSDDFIRSRFALLPSASPTTNGAHTNKDF